MIITAIIRQPQSIVNLIYDELAAEILAAEITAEIDKEILESLRTNKVHTGPRSITQGNSK